MQIPILMIDDLDKVNQLDRLLDPMKRMAIILRRVPMPNIPTMERIQRGNRLDFKP